MYVRMRVFFLYLSYKCGKETAEVEDEEEVEERNKTCLSVVLLNYKQFI